MGGLRREVREIVERVEAAAEANLRLLTIDETRAAGLSDSAVDRLGRSGRWVRRGRGVYSVAGRDGGPFQPVLVALLVGRPTAFARSVTTAALRGGLDLQWDGTVDVAALPSGSSGRRRLQVPEEHITVVQDRFRCTDGLQTTVDLACILDDVRWEWALEAALRIGEVTIGGIEDVLRCGHRRDAHAVRVIRDVLARRPPGAPPTESLLETRTVQLLRDHGFPTPVRQHPVPISANLTYRLDLAFPALRFFIECDGRHHADQQLHDADRFAAIKARTGWDHLILTTPQVVRTPRTTARRLAAIFAAQAA